MARGGGGWGLDPSLPLLHDHREDRSRLLLVVHGGQMGGSRCNFKAERFGLVPQRNLFPVRKAQQWSGLPREGMELPLLEVLSKLA